jgi:hypothetical protein
MGDNLNKKRSGLWFFPDFNGSSHVQPEEPEEFEEVSSHASNTNLIEFPVINKTNSFEYKCVIDNSHMVICSISLADYEYLKTLVLSRKEINLMSICQKMDLPLVVVRNLINDIKREIQIKKVG